MNEELISVDATTGEVAKVVENTYRDVQIAFANEVALACEALNVDFNDVRRCVNSLPFNSNAYCDLHLPGAGVGGHCLPKDPWLLKYGVDTYGQIQVPFDVIVRARNRNAMMPSHMLKLVKRGAKKAGINFSKAKIAILGASFIENSENTRNSPTETIVELLEKENVDWAIHDPYVRQQDFPYPVTKDLDTVLKDADVLVLMVKQKDCSELKPAFLKEKMRTNIVIDGRDVFDLPTLNRFTFPFGPDDGQAIQYSCDGETIWYRLKLSKCSQPKSRQDWEWMESETGIPIKILKKIRKAMFVQPRKPTLILKTLKGGITYSFLQFPWEYVKQTKQLLRTERVLAVDLGLKKLATAVVCETGKQISRPIYLKLVGGQYRHIERLYKNIAGIQKQIAKLKQNKNCKVPFKKEEER